MSHIAPPKFDPWGDDDLYVIADDHSGYLKVGRAANPKKRLAQFQTANPRELRLQKEFSSAGFIEPLFHALFEAYAVRGEWYPSSSLPATVLDAWDPYPVVDKGTLLQTFGEAVYAGLRLKADHIDEWGRASNFAEFDRAGLRACVTSEVRRRDEFHRRAVRFAGFCREIHGEDIEVPALPGQTPYDYPDVMWAWEDFAADYEESRARQQRYAEFLRREAEQSEPSHG